MFCFCRWIFDVFFFFAAAVFCSSMRKCACDTRGVTEEGVIRRDDGGGG